MVCTFNFVRYGHIKKKLALFVPRFNSDGPLKSEVSQFKNLDFLIFKSFEARRLISWNESLYFCPEGVL